MGEIRISLPHQREKGMFEKICDNVILYITDKIIMKKVNSTGMQGG